MLNSQINYLYFAAYFKYYEHKNIKNTKLFIVYKIILFVIKSSSRLVKICRDLVRYKVIFETFTL